MTKLLAARQIVTSMVTGILLWCVIGIGVSVLVSATLVLGYALFIVKDALAPAALSGAVQGLWLYLARNRWSGKKELVWFGIISGAALGLLDSAPAYVTTTACFGWGHIFLFVIAALAGGSSAGYVMVAVEAERLIIKGIVTGTVLTIINSDPATPLTAEQYPLGKLIALSDPSASAPN